MAANLFHSVFCQGEKIVSNERQVIFYVKVAFINNFESAFLNDLIWSKHFYILRYNKGLVNKICQFWK